MLKSVYKMCGRVKSVYIMLGRVLSADCKNGTFYRAHTGSGQRQSGGDQLWQPLQF